MIFRIKIFGIFRFPNKKNFEFFFINSSSISKKIKFFFQNVDKNSKNSASFALGFVSLALLRASKNRLQHRPCYIKPTVQPNLSLWVAPTRCMPPRCPNSSTGGQVELHSKTLNFRVLPNLDTRPHSFISDLVRTRQKPQLSLLNSSFTRVFIKFEIFHDMMAILVRICKFGTILD